MSPCVGVLCSEGGAKGIDVAESAGIVLAVELTGHSQERRACKEIPRVIDLTCIKERPKRGS